jgi:DNA-binding IclR family transcriptional regulator
LNYKLTIQLWKSFNDVVNHIVIYSCEQTNDKEHSMTVQSVERAIIILQQFTADVPLLGVADISRQLDLDRSAVQRAVASLVDGGLLEQDSVSGKYRLGLGLLELAGTMLQGRNLPAVIRPFLRELTDLVGESVYFGILYHGDSVLQIDDVASKHLIQYPGWTGRRLPLYCTASGKVLLANMLPERVEKLLNTMELRALAPRTITDHAELLNELATIRECGYATDFQEFQGGVNAIAACVSVPGAGVPAAVTVVGPKYRFSEAQALGCTDALLAVATEVSHRLLTTASQWSAE